jgi:hypothetical protein
MERDDLVTVLGGIRLLFFLKRNVPLTNAFLDANRVERMEIMLCMDRLLSTP